MKKKRNISGFTMAELLIVVAIIAVLSGVGFIAVQSHRKALEQSEANTIAKEIFFAAQNHLTMAESEGYLAETVGSSFYGISTSRLARDAANAKDIYYFSVSGSGAFAGNTALDLMLPFGSIDDTIRLSGNYVIRYQANPARVLDVWYGKSGKVTLPAIGELVGITTGRNGIGYYGGDAALEGGVTLDVPTIEVQNAERLTVTVKGTEGYAAVTDSEGHAAVSLKLLITGETSKAMAAVPILQTPNNRVATADGGAIVVTLDDITKPYNETFNDSYHFADIAKGPGAAGSQIIVEEGENGTFIPGENITVQAVAFSTQILASIAYSNEVTTNSLFADVVDGVAQISNIRHLENLDKSVSGVNTSDLLTITGANQTADLVWSQTDDSTSANDAFTAMIESPSIYKLGETSGTEAGYFLPVNIDYSLVYDGVYTEGTGADAVKKCHSISGITVKTTGTDPAGLFGEITAKAENGVAGAVTVRNLELVNFEISGTGATAGSAGALAGKAEGTTTNKVTIENVLAHNTTAFDGARTAATIQAAGGSAGGLVGEMINCEVKKCAAALVVSSTKGDAGGLIGASSGGSVKASYSGGHTKSGDEIVGVVYDKTVCNVTATDGSAGGLIGNAGGTSVQYSYSTCSASGSVTGGLVGEAEGNIISCYSTGFVKGTSKAGAFAGKKEAGSVSSCQYFEIINPTETTVDGTTTYGYLPPVDGSPTVAGITALDADAKSYNDFCFTPQASDTWISPEPYEAELATLFVFKPSSGDAASYYPLKAFKDIPGSSGVTVNETASAIAPADFVATHYGDWPAPEILVINAANSSGGAGGFGL